MHNQLFTFLLFFLFSGSLLSQDVKSQMELIAERADSIRIISPNKSLSLIEDLDSLLMLYPDDKFQLKSYILRSKTLRSVHKDEEAKPYTEKALDLANQIKDTIGLLNGYSGLADYYFVKKNTTTAQSYYEKMIAVAKQNNDFLKEEIYAYHGLGQLFLGVNDSLSIKYLLAAKELIHRIDFPNLEGSLYYKLAIIYKNQKKWTKSNEMAELAIEKFETNSIYIFQVYDIMIKNYGYLKDIDNSRKYFEKAINSTYGLKINYLRAYNTFGVILTSNNNLEEAEVVLKKGIDLGADEPGLKSKYSQLLANLGDVLYQKGKYQEALFYFEKAKKLFFENPNTSLENKKLILEFYLKSLGKTKRYNKLGDLLDEFVTLSDSINRKSQQSIDEEMMEKYRAEVKEAENKELLAAQELKEEQIKSQRRNLMGTGIALVFISFLSFLFYRQREKQKLLNTELTTQRDQIKTLNRELNHRVKNNLAFMTSLLEMQGRRTDNTETKQILRESESRLKALSIVHDNLFKNETQTTINLKKYLIEITTHLQNIFEIPGKSLTVETQLADIDFDAEDAMRVGLVVNELVTNSVKHAFADVDDPKIVLETAQGVDGRVVLRYKDNGPGFVQKDLKAASASSGSIGVKLIQLLEQQLVQKMELTVG